MNAPTHRAADTPTPHAGQPTPASPPLSAQQRAQLMQIIELHRETPGGMLPLLHAVQDAWGHVPDAAVPDIARAMNRSRAEVHGVITFYHHFRSHPAGRHVVQVCQAESCQACGSQELMRAAELVLGCKAHETSANGAVSLEPVYCLGLCASSPAIQVDARPYARVETERLQRLLAHLVAAGESDHE